ncbi:MAG: glycosyltransferase family 4 protein [Uliginosibacterium sp.]|jgi:Fuc2NAc and GlcNAc transferase|nr:glycosyltransferase family 4 protein [Uliginosibacterium sp.]
MRMLLEQFDQLGFAGHQLVWVILFGAFLFAWAGSAVMRHYAIRKGMLDRPNARSSHTIPTPRGGGIAFVFATAFGIAALIMTGDVAPIHAMVLLPGSLLIAAVGFWDDRSSLPALFKLALHTLAAACALAFLGGWSTVSFGWGAFHWGFVGSIVGMAWLIWATNLYNFMDGIDGLAITQALFLALTGAVLALITGGEPLVLVLLALSCLGFAFLNWPPAKLFMGDAGSGFLGFTFGVIALESTVSMRTTCWPWLILMGVFLVDASYTLLYRMLDQQRWLEPHCLHAYQKAARRVGAHRPVTLSVIAINLLWLMPLALTAHFFPAWGALLAVLALAPLVVLASRFEAGKRDGTGVAVKDEVLARPALPEALQTELGG